MAIDRSPSPIIIINAGIQSWNLLALLQRVLFIGFIAVEIDAHHHHHQNNPALSQPGFGVRVSGFGFNLQQSWALLSSSEAAAARLWQRFDAGR
jgi:hypothetical protein